MRNIVFKQFYCLMKLFEDEQSSFNFIESFYAFKRFLKIL